MLLNAVLRKFYLTCFILGLLSSPLFAQHAVSAKPLRQSLPAKEVAAPEPPNLFVEEFFMSPSERLDNPTEEVAGFVFVKTPNREKNSNYSVVTNFRGRVIKTQVLPGLLTAEDVKNWVDKNLESSNFEGVEIRRLKIPTAGDGEKYLYWVGHKSFASSDDANSQIALVKSIAETQGMDFESMVSKAKRAVVVPEKPPPVEIKVDAQFLREEAMALRWADQMDIGTNLFGPFHGTSPGERILWQSFGETTWRQTNLEAANFSNQVGYWTNRLVFKGIRFPINTICPYVEDTVSLESNGIEFKSNMQLWAGLEWRPFEQNVWLTNFRDTGGIPILEWIKNYRFYIQYGERKNIKDAITNSHDTDLQAGVSIFYEFGIDLPTVAEETPSNFSDYLRKYVWGEYYGNYFYTKTGFSSFSEFNAFIFNSSVTLGLKLPGIPLPSNPINDELMLMPYARFEHVNNAVYSLDYQNRCFVAAGVRWMPFRNYRYKENEWLSKVKIFGEYVGVGRTQFTKSKDEPPTDVRYDLRFGVNISSRRF